MPRPCSALTIAGSPRPSPANSQASSSRRSESTLFATTRTAPPCRRTSWATTASSPVTPVVVSSDEQDKVRFAERTQGLFGHLGVERVSTFHDPAGVDDEKRSSVPLAFELQPVACDARAGLDDGNLATDEPVHEGRLADVRASDHGDDRQSRRRRCSHRAVSRRLRRDAPSVGTTSTSRGRSSSEDPSMNLPLDRQTSGSR